MDANKSSAIVPMPPPSGWIVEPFEKYAAERDYLRSSELAAYRKSPRLYQLRRESVIPDVDTTARIIGRAFHAFAFEGPTEYGRRFLADGPINPRTGAYYGRDTKAYADWIAENALGREVLSPDDGELVVRMAGSLRAMPWFDEVMGRGFPELVVRSTVLGRKCQVRIDWTRFNAEYPDGEDGAPVLTPAAVVEGKTCRDVDWFERDAREYGYIHQVALERQVLREAFGVDLPVFFLASEKADPNRAGCWQVPIHILDRAEEENCEAIELLQESEASGKWPTGYELIREIEYF